jgi:hypothetical protein
LHITLKLLDDIVVSIKRLKSESLKPHSLGAEFWKEVLVLGSDQSQVIHNLLLGLDNFLITC